jgi:hypothetical protein
MLLSPTWDLENRVNDLVRGRVIRVWWSMTHTISDMREAKYDNAHFKWTGQGYLDTVHDSVGGAMIDQVGAVPSW